MRFNNTSDNTFNDTGRHFEPLSGVVLFFVGMACIRATSVDSIEILAISPNTLSYKIHLLRYDLIDIRNAKLYNLNYFIKQRVIILSQEPLL